MQFKLTVALFCAVISALMTDVGQAARIIGEPYEATEPGPYMPIAGVPAEVEAQSRRIVEQMIESGWPVSRAWSEVSSIHSAVEVVLTNGSRVKFNTDPSTDSAVFGRTFTPEAGSNGANELSVFNTPGSRSLSFVFPYEEEVRTGETSPRKTEPLEVPGEILFALASYEDKSANRNWYTPITLFVLLRHDNGEVYRATYTMSRSSAVSNANQGYKFLLSGPPTRASKNTLNQLKGASATDVALAGPSCESPFKLIR